MRAGWLAVALSVLAPAAAAAEWQARPFIGFTFSGVTTFVDLEGGAQSQNIVIGGSGGWLGEIFGLEGDFSRAPGFFQVSGADLLLSSSVTTLTGNVVIAFPRRMVGYSLRPYFVGGAGLMHVKMFGQLGGVDINRTLPALSFGGGVTGYLTNRVGLNWEVRRLSTLQGEGETLGNSVGTEQLSFWRATMGVALRY